jgi:ABC-type ATPase with predicted acetyltransferase domain
MTIPPVMFGESQFVDKNETDVEIRTVTLTKEVWTTLKDFNFNNQITNFEFFKDLIDFNLTFVEMSTKSVPQVISVNIPCMKAFIPDKVLVNMFCISLKGMMPCFCVSRTFSTFSKRY